MTKYPQLSNALKKWWKQQTKWKNYKSLSKECNIPVGTLKKYFYGIKWPKQQNAEKLHTVTGLEIFKPGLDTKKFQYAFRTFERLNHEIARVLGSLPPVMDELCDIGGGVKQDWIIATNTIQLLMDALERSLRPFLDSTEGLEILRKQLRGPDAGYLSGLLSSIFDDKRLSTWKEMTTYKYGG